MAKKLLTVTYNVQMFAKVYFDPETEDRQDAVSNIDIPEGGKNDSQYVDNSFEVFDVQEENV